MVPQSSIAASARLARARLLDEVAELVAGVPPRDRNAFADAVDAALAAGVQASEIAKPLGLAVSTVTRWAEGGRAVHPVNMRDALLQIVRSCRARADALRTAATGRMADAA